MILTNNSSLFGRIQFKLGESLINKPCGNLPSLNNISNVIIYRILLPTLAGATVCRRRHKAAAPTSLKPHRRLFQSLVLGFGYLQTNVSAQNEIAL